MTIPATPIKEAALRYSPEIAEAFQPTDTARPATKKSEAVRERRAAQNPIQIVARTVSRLNARMKGPMAMPITPGSSPPEVEAGRRAEPRMPSSAGDRLCIARMFVSWSFRHHLSRLLLL